MIIATEKQFNTFLNVFFQNTFYQFDDYTPINRQTLQYLPWGDSQEEIEEQYELVDLLQGYSMKYTTDGEHKNDGQMVEYTFKFISPARHVTTYTTDMCLAVGFNVGEDITIR